MTDHLTSFALLLDSTGSSSEDLVFFWLSAALIGASIICILVSIVIIEIRYKRLTHKREQTLEMISRLQEEDSLPRLRSNKEVL